MRFDPKAQKQFTFTGANMLINEWSRILQMNSDIHHYCYFTTAQDKVIMEQI